MASGPTTSVEAEIGYAPAGTVVADRYLRLGAVVEAVQAGDPTRVGEPASAPAVEVDDSVGEAIPAAIAAMDALLSEARDADGEVDLTWCARVEAARDAVVRMSIELRAVVTRVPAPG